MNNRWTVILALVFLGVAIGVERLSAAHLGRMNGRKAVLNERLSEAEARAHHVARERTHYQALLETAERINARTVWEEDSTNLLRWFADTAAETGVRLNSGKVVSSERKDEETVAGGKFAPLRFELRLAGGYWPLARYVERIENAPSPMLIETLALDADRTTQGEGDLRLTVVSLHPAKEKAKAVEEPT